MLRFSSIQIEDVRDRAFSDGGAFRDDGIDSSLCRVCGCRTCECEKMGPGKGTEQRKSYRSHACGPQSSHNSLGQISEQGVSNAIHLVLKCPCCRDNLRLDDLRNRCLIILIGFQRALLGLNRTQMFEEGFSRPDGLPAVAYYIAKGQILQHL
jgi:hypothetical protein